MYTHELKKKIAEHKWPLIKKAYDYGWNFPNIIRFM